MKKYILALSLALLLIPAIANAAVTVKQVATKYVCMINNEVFEKEQIPVIVDDKTYYGCCHACEAMLNNDPKTRTAIDPISKKTVDKATAVIGANDEGKVFYFESLKNLEAFNE